MSNTVTLGQIAPDFALSDPMTGQTVRLSDHQGKDVLLVFLRGTWCPFCREQLRILAESHERLQSANIAVLAVVCQSTASVKRYLDANPLPFPLLPDGSRATAKAYGTHYWLSLEGANLSHPALFILDKSGSITFAHVGRNMRDLPVAVILERFLSLLA